MISHKAIANGGKLVFEMGPKANKAWGTSLETAPASEKKQLKLTLIRN